jgi:hypothetical protein
LNGILVALCNLTVSQFAKKSGDMGQKATAGKQSKKTETNDLIVPSK